MKVLIYGTGAIGGYVGGRLAISGHEVVLLARARVADAIREKGLLIEEDGRFALETVRNAHVFSDLQHALQGTPLDLILFCMKAFDTAQALDDLRAACPDPPPILCLQNGIGNEAAIADAFKPEKVIAGTITTAALMTEPGRVVVERKRGMGIATGHPMSAVILDICEEAGLRPRPYRDAIAMKWSKVLVNITANAASAITGLPTRAIFEHPGLYRLEVESLREGVRVMVAMGLKPVNLPRVRVSLFARGVFLPASITKPLLSRAVISGRGEKRPSFLSDLGRGKSEVAWLNGAIAREGERLGVPVPANRLLTDTLTGLIEGRFSREEFRGKPERLLRMLPH